MGSSDPEWFMAYGHMNPDELLLAYEDLGRPYLFSTHHMVFPLADTGYGEPQKRLEKVLLNHAEIKKRIRVLIPGQSWIVAKE